MAGLSFQPNRMSVYVQLPAPIAKNKRINNFYISLPVLVLLKTHTNTTSMFSDGSVSW